MKKNPLKQLFYSITNSWKKLPDSYYYQSITNTCVVDGAFRNFRVEATQAIFGAHNVNGAAFNKLLEDRGISTPRVILTPPRELEMVDGHLQVVPLPQPEVIEEVVEEPILEE